MIDSHGVEGELSGMAWPIKGEVLAVHPASTPGPVAAWLPTGWRVYLLRNSTMCRANDEHTTILLPLQEYPNKHMKKIIVNRILECFSPSKIAIELGTSTKDVLSEIEDCIANGNLRRTDVLRTFDKDMRNTIDNMRGVGTENILFFIKKLYSQFDQEEAKWYVAYPPDKVRAGEMYEMIADIERNMHSFIRISLIKSYGCLESGWWNCGVPEKIRVDCVSVREKSSAYEDSPYSFTSFIDLGEIISSQFKIFEKCLPSSIRGKKEVRRWWLKLNIIRNKIMHPIREELPDTDDFDFVREAHRLTILMTKP